MREFDSHERGRKVTELEEKYFAESSEPLPGSDEARRRGCTCPVADNENGEGRNGCFLVNGTCPLHGYKL